MFEINIAGVCKKIRGAPGLGTQRCLPKLIALSSKDRQNCTGPEHCASMKVNLTS